MADSLMEYIKILPPEIREMIYKEYVKSVIKQKEDMGFKKIHFLIKNAPYCEKNEMITKISKCGECHYADEITLTMYYGECQYCHYKNTSEFPPYDDEFNICERCYLKRKYHRIDIPYNSLMTEFYILI